MDGFVELVHAAFIVAARRKFSPAWTRAQVIHFVAQVRGLLSERPHLVDPTLAELELRRALGENVSVQSDLATRASVQFILLDALTASLDLDGQSVADLLDQARTEATIRLALSALVRRTSLLPPSRL
ncbi:MAG: hypothetical protein JO345_08340 [Streptosporangiaceae bacterium]|nr:hypothetical protein [Streptosporangiaceae bacterium]